MMRKKERLSRQEFNRFFSLGKRHQSAVFQLIHTPHEALHVSVVVSKKLEPKAVKRNSLRRRVYDVMRNYAHAENLKGVFIFLMKAPSTTLPYNSLKTEVQRAVGRLEKLY